MFVDTLPVLGRSDRITYTHFWASGPDKADARMFTRFCADVQILTKELSSLTVPNSIGISPYGFNKSIEFHIPHEPEFGIFLLTGRPQSFAFCRTNGRKADLLVTSVLLAAKKHFKDWICLTSDGLWSDWQPAKDFCMSYLQYAEDDFQAAKKDFDSLENRDIELANIKVPYDKVFSPDDTTSEELKVKE